MRAHTGASTITDLPPRKPKGVIAHVDEGLAHSRELFAWTSRFGKRGLRRTHRRSSGLGKTKLTEARPNYIERPVVELKKAMERAQKQVRAERNRRAHFRIASSARG